MPAARPSKAAISNAIHAATAARAAGFNPASIRIDRDGSMIIDLLSPELTAAANSGQSPNGKTPKKWGERRA